MQYCTYNITKVKFLITHVDTACYQKRIIYAFANQWKYPKKIYMVQLIICSKFLVNITVNNCKVLYNVKQINLIHIEPFKQELGLSVGCYYLICLSKSKLSNIDLFSTENIQPWMKCHCVQCIQIINVYIISR